MSRRRSRRVWCFRICCKFPTPHNSILTSTTGQARKSSLVPADTLLLFQHRRHRPRLHRLPPPRDFPRLARRAGRPHRLGHRHQTLPLPARLPSRSRPHLHLQHFRPRQCAMAAHGFRRSGAGRSGFREWKCQVRSGDGGDGPGMVWVRVAHRGDDWFAGDDFEYSAFG